jgi:hypothetical protein
VDPHPTPFWVVLKLMEIKVGRDPARRFENYFAWITARVHRVCELSQSEFG